MDKIIGDTRGNDLGGIRYASMAYLVKNPLDPAEGISTANKDKTVRGFKNLSTARMLCPYRCLNAFDESPKTYVSSLAIYSL